MVVSIRRVRLKSVVETYIGVGIGTRRGEGVHVAVVESEGSRERNKGYFNTFIPYFHILGY